MNTPVLSPVAQALDDLLAAFPSHKGTSDRMLAIYTGGLRGLDDAAVRAAVDLSIRDDMTFPRVARLWELANEWKKRNRADFEIIPEDNPETCRVCGERAKPITLTRPSPEGGAEEFRSKSTYVYHNPARHHVKPVPT